MRSDEEQLRHMERQDARGELTSEQRKRMEVLRVIVAEDKGEVRSPKPNVEATPSQAVVT